MTDGNRKSGDTSGLLGDLESIRTLLEQPGDGDSGQAPDPGGGPPAEDSGRRDDDVPLLEDVVHGGVSLNETFLGGQGDFEIDAGDSGLNEDVFKALLSDEWRESARELLDQAAALVVSLPHTLRSHHLDRPPAKASCAEGSLQPASAVSRAPPLLVMSGQTPPPTGVVCWSIIGIRSLQDASKAELAIF